MGKKRAWKRAAAGLMAAFTVMVSVLSPLSVYAQETETDAYVQETEIPVREAEMAVYAQEAETEEKPPFYEDVKELLDEDETVKAEDYELEIGSTFDPAKDFSGIDIPEGGKVRVAFEEAKNGAGENFANDHEDVYKAVYYVEPLMTDHPKYQISRNLIVKEAAAGTGEAVLDGMDTDTVAALPEETEDSEAQTGNTPEDAVFGEPVSETTVDTQAIPAEPETASPETEAGETDWTEEAQTEPGMTEDVEPEIWESLDEEHLDEDLEASDGQDTYDEESGLTLYSALEQGAEAGIDLASLEMNETVSFIAATASGSKKVEVSVVAEYKYTDYGLGTFLTHKYQVVFGGTTATAYCIQPSKGAPPAGKYEISKIKDGKALAKVCYYGTKAAGEEGFFVENHPDFNAGKRFIITHLAASYASGSSDAFSGANETGRALAMELYNYCVAQPAIPDVDMALSEANTAAYVEGDHQRTNEITFIADPLQSITMSIPAGVTLHNVSTGVDFGAGSQVVLTGGTRFYLTAPLTQVIDVGPVWSCRMNGSITKDYSAYKISTGGGIQNLALVFGDGVDEQVFVDFSVKWIEIVDINVKKTDSETGNGLAGAVFGVYADAGCTSLLSQLPATDVQGAASVRLVKTQNVMYLKEITVPQSYMRNDHVYTMDVTGTITYSCTVPNERVKAKVRMTKVDAETGSPQGDATLAGAVYGLYARGDIVHPDGKTGVLYHAGNQVATLTTDETGAAVAENLYLGNYYLKEISPSTGYNLSTEEYDISFSYEGPDVPLVEKACTVKETVIKQPFQVIKAANNGKTDADLLSGVGFTAYLVSSLQTKGDGSYDFSSAKPVVTGKNGVTEIFTDSKGHAVSIAIPYGTYLVRETTTPHNFKPVKDFLVRITENHPTEPQVWRVLLDDAFEAKLKIVKQDDETKRPVLAIGTEFKVYDLDNGKYVEQVTTYPVTVTHTSYFTDSEGYLILPQNLPAGNYRVEEVTAPEGYTVGQAVDVAVDSDTMYQVDPASGDAIIEVVYENHPVKGKLRVVKKGEVLAGYGKHFEYEVQPLAGAVFALTAAEDIFTADYQKDADGNRICEYRKGELVAELTTGEDGEAVLADLPLGRYSVAETKAPEGYVLNGEAQEVLFEYAGQETAVVEQTAEFADERQRVQVKAVKKDAENEAPLAGAGFGLYAKEDITAGGKVIVPADTLLAEAESGEDGCAAFDADLPFGVYYIREVKAPAGYLSNAETKEITASYQGQEIMVAEFAAEFTDQPTVTEFTKSDLTTGVELDGASLTVLDKDGNVVDAWTSVRDQPHMIKRLHVGETYTLREEFAPYGYLRAEEVRFTVEDTEEVQKVEMKDAVPTALLIIAKNGEFLDKVTLLDDAKGMLFHLFGYITGSLPEVTFEVYAAEDIKAADGTSADYYKADELVGTITTDAGGIAQLGGLPVGKYYVKEAETAHGFILDGEPRYVDLSYRDQDTPVVTYSEAWQNARQKARVHILKKEKNGSRVLAGGVFGLYTAEDIWSAGGDVLMKKGTLIEQRTTDEKGEISFLADLPVDGSFYIREIKAPDGFVASGEKQEFVFEYAGEDQEEKVFEFVFEDEATTVELTKADLTTGKELPGAHLRVIKENGDLVDEWVSGEKPHVIRELTVGETYELTETKPADGYVTAESIVFTVENTAEIQKHRMEDDVTKVSISKTDITGTQEVPGAKLTILDQNDQVVESWTSKKKPHYVEKLPVGRYTLREERAPEGYVLTEDVAFTVSDTGEIQSVQMKDDTAKGKVILNKTDKETGRPLAGVEFELRDGKGRALETLKTDAAGHAESGLYEIASYKGGVYDKALCYYLMETKALDGYIPDDMEHEIVFKYAGQSTPVIEVKLDFTNKPSGEPVPVSGAPKTGDQTPVALMLVLMAGAAGVAVLLLAIKRKRA